MSSKENKGLLPIGFGNAVSKDKIIAVLNPKSAPIVRFRDELKKDNRIIDVTHGRKTRAIIVTESYVLLSGISFETLIDRFHE